MFGAYDEEYLGIITVNWIVLYYYYYYYYFCYCHCYCYYYCYYYPLFSNFRYGTFFILHSLFLLSCYRSFSE